ncbi:MAG: uroporphyrinogen-III synthase [Arachnia sp.]
MALAGAEVIRAQITTVEPVPLDELRRALDEPWDWIVITSALTARILHQAGISLPSGVKIAAVGPATAAALETLQVRPDLVADPGGGAALAAAMPAGPGRILAPGAALPSQQPAAALRAKAWSVYQVPVYRSLPVPIPEEIRAAWPGLDAVIITAGSIATALVAAAGLPGPGAIAIGDPSARAATRAGLTVIATAAAPTADALLDAALAALATQGHP